ncbi:Mobile element protein [hydrothermal vent metagenome]|uniref:Mobile element protein n=1 Tax=hydrothermal vent metagenome TaxID=652676 RepID=A0A3B0V9Z5_9ZZZZ
MTTARKQLVSLEDTPYYHCYVRCVRRAFICGDDKCSGNNYDHRRQWIKDKIMAQIELFAIDCCAYAVMSNHYHVVLCVDEERAKSWDNREVLRRWSELYSLSYLTTKYYNREGVSKAELDAIYVEIEKYRDRLMSLSWFMRGINESTARRANAEDNCKGRFWEGRFKSQALLDEKAVLTCMAYVDLNPIRAKIAQTPEDSDYTSIQERIKQKNSKLKIFGKHDTDIPFALDDYLALVDCTGRAIIAESKGYIPAELPEILTRLGLNSNIWLDEIKYFDTWYYKAIGRIENLKKYCKSIQQQWIKGLPKVNSPIKT